jgi:predicted DNA-binding transcriptional regulator YafY
MTDVKANKIKKVLSLITLLSDATPRTIKKLAELLEVSGDTVYRYIPLLEEVGYQIEKNKSNEYYIDYKKLKEFTEVEKKHLLAFVRSSSLNKNIKDGIAAKLKINTTLPDPHTLATLESMEKINKILFCIENSYTLTLENYRSTNPKSTKKTRHILPLQFDHDTLSIKAYDLDEKSQRLYKLHRIASMEINAKFEGEDINLHDQMMDDFGFWGKCNLSVSLLLSARAKALLTEEIPSTALKIANTTSKEYPFKYTAKVSNYEGIGRFVMGLGTEIKIEKDKGLIDYVKQKLSNRKLF